MIGDFEKAVLTFISNYDGEQSGHMLDVFVEHKEQLFRGELFDSLYEIFVEHQEMPYDVANNGDPYALIEEKVSDIIWLTPIEDIAKLI